MRCDTELFGGIPSLPVAEEIWHGEGVEESEKQYDATACKVIYPMSFAMPNATAAAIPPTRTVCQALRTGWFVVKLPLTKPNTNKASSVTITEPIKALCTECKKK